MDETITNTFKPINIKEIFIQKNPGLAKIMPGFVFSYIHRLLHIDFINDFIQRNGHLKGIDFVDQGVTEFNVKEHIYGFENIPESGRFIFASNHPLGGFDSLLLMKYVNKKLGKLKFLSNDVLMGIPSLSYMFIPVNKHGTNSREVANTLDNAYNSDDQILIFPSGLASRRIKGIIVDLPWKKHFVTKAVNHKRDVIPVFIGGRNSNRFYIVANIRKFLHLKWNIEMFLLPDELMRQKNADIPVYFGKPIPYQTFNKSKTHQEWADWVKEQVYKIPNQVGNKN
ncbi:MAG: 1-acyl-sn-glycerol-3-phosphate acyltransferase [Draconibacterium sp.]|nr:1-acyl-sn-glycerol-3-phosphate acyltransferase [Draconibacterium sp.]